ncbi:MAG: Replicative DNA helicase [Phycisphaerae bacterium]|nr:Replicative DNA helicase [Phycisphaerae bacterium]
MVTIPQPSRNPDPPLPPPGPVPPQDLDAEMSLLGSMMIDREAIEQALMVLGREDAACFYRPDHQELFKVLLDLYDQNRAIDLVVVKDELLRRDLLRVIGEEYMITLVESVGSWQNASHYARIVRDKGLLRELIQCSTRIIKEAYDQGDNAKNIIDRAEQALFLLTDKRISNPAVQLRDMLTEIYRQITSQDSQHITGLPTGFLELDELTNGFQPGELIIIAARPSMGKTAIGLNIAEHIAVQERQPVVFFSMEMSRQQISQRILCSRGRIDSHKFRRNLLTEQDIAHLGYVCQELSDAPLFIDDTPGMSLLEMRAKVRRMCMQARYKVNCVFVDYLQLMHVPRTEYRNENRQQEISFISRGLKAVARELKVPVIAMAQLNRASEMRDGNRPRMSDLRESGAIEQDADVVILLHREEYYKPQDINVKGKAELILAKQRNGPTGTVELHFDHRLTRFATLSRAPEPVAPLREPEELTPF